MLATTTTSSNAIERRDPDRTLSEQTSLTRSGFTLVATTLGGIAGLLAWSLLSRRVPGLDPVGERAVTGAIAVLAVAAILVVHSRLARRLRGARNVVDALGSYAAGERDLDALHVEAGLDPSADGLNRLLDECRARHADEVEDRATQLLSSQGAVEGGLGVAVDALWQGVVLLDANLQVRQANHAAAVLLGSENDLVGARFETLIDSAEVLEAARAITATGCRSRQQCVVRRTDGGGEETILRVGIRAAARDGERGAVILIEDSTQQAKTDEARNAFVTQATHELRGPLANIRLYVETAMNDGEEDSVLRGRCLNVINSESRRLDRLVADMLSVAEIEAGALSLQVDDVRTDQLLDEIEHDYAAQAKERSITLKFNPAPKMPVIDGDRDKIAIVLHNLLNNALKYTSEGGRVDVNIEVSDSTFAVEVADTGFGISPDEIDRIFDRFHRVTDDDRVAETVGSGLGLALARDIARLHGGDITVESEPDVGSRFHFVVPLSAQRADLRAAA